MIFRNSLKRVLTLAILLLARGCCQASNCVLSPASTGLASSYDIISNFQSGRVGVI